MGWLDTGLDIGSLLLDLYSASDKKGKELDVGELFRLQNPNISSPFMTSTSDWNRGNPTQTREFSPAVAAIVEPMMAQLAQGRDPREMSTGMRGLFGATEDYQRSRYGLDPADRSYSSDSFTGGSPTDGDDETPDYGGSPTGGVGYSGGVGDPGGGSGGNADYRGGGGDWVPGGSDFRGGGGTSASNYDILDDLGLGWLNPDARGSGIPYSDEYGGFGSDGIGNTNNQPAWEQIMRAIAPLLAGSAVPGSNWLTDNWLDNQIIGDDASGIMSPDSPGFVPPGGAPTGGVGYSGDPSGGYGGNSGYGASMFGPGGAPSSSGWGGMGWGTYGRMGGGLGKGIPELPGRLKSKLTN